MRAFLAAAGLGLLVPGSAAAASPPSYRSGQTTPPLYLSGQISPLTPAQPANPVRAQSATPAFREPVDAEVTDGWRPPDTPYGPGNRGWQYDTADGDLVRSAGNGTVTFAGSVGGVLAVTVTHRGGLRTSYTRLDSIEVHAGDVVVVGQRLGTALTDFHFGVRLHDTYIDPGLLFTPGALRYGARLRPL